jgi:hypothetical protein
MTTTYSQTVFSPWLTPVRLVSVANIAGTYNNGQEGVGATLTIAASSLTIDSVLCVVGDRVLLQTQTNTNEQGIYIVKSIGTTVVLERADDQQCIEQIKAGQYVSVGAGSVQAGNIFTIVEPIPAIFGVDALVINADPSAAGVAFSGGPSVANALAVFSDTAGNIKPATTTVTLGQPFSVAGPITSTTGNITSGSSADAGTFISFPATAANGTFIMAAANAGAAFNTTISNGTMAQSTVYTIGDIGAATGGIPVATGAVRMKVVADAAAAGGSATQNIVDAFCTAASVVIAVWQTQANAAVIRRVVPGVGSFDVISDVDAGVGTLNYVIFK